MEEDEWCWKCIISMTSAVFAVLIHVFPLPPGCGVWPLESQKNGHFCSHFCSFPPWSESSPSLCLPPEVKPPRNVFFLFYFPGIDLAGCVCREQGPVCLGFLPASSFDLAGGLRGCVLSLSQGLFQFTVPALL